jgi:hypothetical protein
MSIELARSRTRLDAAIRAVCPISGTSGIAPNVRIDFLPEATQQQKDAAAAVLAAFDWGGTAHEEWIAARRREEAKDDIGAVVVAPSREVRLARALAATLLDELNLRSVSFNALLAQIAAATSLADLKSRVAANVEAYPTRTMPQLRASIESKIDGNA